MILKIDQLSFSYNKQQIFDKIDLQIKTPGIYGLVAPNGSGKTTLLQLISGLHYQKKGTIEIFEQSNNHKEVFQNLSFVQDNTVLYPYLSGKDHLEFICHMHKLSSSEISEVVNLLGMENYIKNNVKTYSLGMKQRLLLAIGLIKKPKLLLLDEPLNGLDPTSTILMRETLLGIEATGTTILVSSHNLNEIDRLTKNIFFIKDLKIIEENMSTYLKETFIIEVSLSDVEKMEQTLKMNAFVYDLKVNAFHFPVKEVNLNELLTVLVDYNISIIDIDKKYTGTEARYRALYEEGFTDET